ncbi:outer membrane protein assembly factor BamA [Suttonella sp. R2A3]|uniref:outer membrane protein assembly factor BamA n=1 Tax=Suttonella sp. R2A3 TaxID=2908648 RepID=UPI001F492A13|nr:outer membrane protein assembly factor BamA [Suttonella sp. R2A3]UJF24822.1 outer membrane protein assembly factor BamA [Suttonella sp. R2A3]
MFTSLRKTALVSAISLAVSTSAFAEAFRVDDIRVEGLQRISAGTVFSYLPVQSGDSFDVNNSDDAIRALYASNLFSDVRLARDGQTLVVQVEEFPTIAQINIEGNKAIKTTDVRSAFAEIGFSEGQSFNPAVINQLVNELANQYQQRSKYSVDITPNVRQLPRNRVAIDLAISEGRSARIRDIEIVGNKVYDDDLLVDLFNTNTGKWNSFITASDQYNEEKIQKDLRALEDFYLNRGFLNFRINSSDIALSPDRKTLYWTINIDEGQSYTITDYQITGDTVLSPEELDQLVAFEVPSVYDHSKVQKTLDELRKRIADEGHAQVQIEPVRDVDPLTQEVSLNFMVVPGPVTYIREIGFTGNDKTYDRVLRRELRQQEAAVYSQSDLDRSQERLRRLPQVATIKQNIVPVPGQTDLVDIEYELTEQSTSYIQGVLAMVKAVVRCLMLSMGITTFSAQATA